jgi:hypothetical protein
MSRLFMMFVVGIVCVLIWFAPISQTSSVNAVVSDRQMGELWK